MSSDLQNQTKLLLPAVDHYRNGFLKQVLRNYQTLAQLFPDVAAKFEARINALVQRQEALKAREAKVSETIQGFQGAKSVIKIETPLRFPSKIEFDSMKVEGAILLSSAGLAKNQAFLQTVQRNALEDAMIHDPKIKGPVPKVDNKTLGESIRSVCQTHRMPMIYPFNSQSQNSYLDKLYLPRTSNYKRKMKYIDGAQVFNTSNSIFYHFVPDKLAEKRQRNATLKANPILESGNLTNFTLGVEQNDDTTETSYQPKTTKQVALLGVFQDNAFGDKIVDDSFFGGGTTMEGDEDDFFSALSKKPQTTTTASSLPSNQSLPNQPISSQTLPSTPGNPQTATIAGQSLSPLPPGSTPAPPTATPGVIPPPPPLALLQQMANSKKQEEEGGNIADETKELKPIAEEKRRLLITSDSLGRNKKRQLQAEEVRACQERHSSGLEDTRLEEDIRSLSLTARTSC